MNEPKKIDWKDVLGNPYLQSLHPLMLLEQGYTTQKSERIRGMSKYAQKVEVQITYRKDYAIEIIVRNILQKLMPNDYNTFQRLMAECWKQYKEGVKNA